MHRNILSIYPRNMRVFYFVDTFRAMWFVTSIWVVYERQFLTLSQLTIIEACILAVTLSMQLPTGAFADLFGKKKAMIIGGLLYSTSMWIYSFSTTFSMFFVYAIFAGLASAFIDGTREALLYDTLKQAKKEDQFSKIASKLSMIFQLTLACAALIGGWLGMYSYVGVIRLTATVFLFATAGCLFFIEPAIDTEKFTVRRYIAKTKLGIGELFKNAYVKKLSLYYILIGSLTWVSVITFNMMLLSELHYSTSEIGLTVGIGRIVNSILLFRLLHVGTFFTRRRTFLLLPIILIFAYIPVVYMTKWWAIIPVMGAMIVSAARWNILSHYTNIEFDSKNRATAISALSMVIGIIFVIVVGASGYIMEHFGGIRILYTLLGCITLITAFPLGIHLANIHKQDHLK
jgi:MFS family permease